MPNKKKYHVNGDSGIKAQVRAAFRYHTVDFLEQSTIVSFSPVTYFWYRLSPFTWCKWSIISRERIFVWLFPLRNRGLSGTAFSWTGYFRDVLSFLFRSRLWEEIVEIWSWEVGWGKPACENQNFWWPYLLLSFVNLCRAGLKLGLLGNFPGTRGAVSHFFKKKWACTCI